jgi:subtilisin family serine protease
MMSLRTLQRILSVLLLAGMLLGFVQPGGVNANPSNTDAEVSGKIKDFVKSIRDAGQADFIVRFTEQADLSPAYEMGWEERQFVYNTLTETADKSQAQAKGMLDAMGYKYQTFITGNELFVSGGKLATAESLAALSNVESVRAPRTFYIDPVVEPMQVTWAGDLLSRGVLFSPGAAPDAITDWGITDTKADQFWAQYGFQGEGIVVANIDTGVQWDHPALVNQFNCPGDPGNPACWEDPSNICAGGTACDNNGHGTHTMGTMVALDDPGLTYIAGMAPGAKWIACKGCESSSCSETALNACADWIVAPNGDPNNRPNVVNNSWGGGGGDNWYLAKVNAWRAAGIFPAFSAGNNYTCSSLGSPGDYQESFASASHQSDRVISDFSSKGPSTFGHDPYTKPNISAPGSSICSSVPTNSWSCEYSGTSMASPHTAGAVALLWSCNSSLIGQIDQTFQILQNTAIHRRLVAVVLHPMGRGTITGMATRMCWQAGLLNCGDVGYIDGTVMDVSGLPIAGATVSTGS